MFINCRAFDMYKSWAFSPIFVAIAHSQACVEWKWMIALFDTHSEHTFISFYFVSFQIIISVCALDFFLISLRSLLLKLLTRKLVHYLALLITIIDVRPFIMVACCFFLSSNFFHPLNFSGLCVVIKFHCRFTQLHWKLCSCGGGGGSGNDLVVVVHVFFCSF